VQSVPNTTNVVSSNPARGEVYSIQHYVIKFVTDLRQISTTNTTYLQSITDILLKVALNTINQIKIEIQVLFISMFFVNGLKGGHT